MPASAICADDVAHWPYAPGLLVKWVSFLGTLHWPEGGLDLGVGGISYVNCSLFMSFGLVRGCLLRERFLGIFGTGVQFQCRLFPFGPGIDIWRSCRFIGSLVRSLSFLPGGLGRFVPCSIGANHCRLRHIGWERCGHGLTSRPRESSSVPFLNELLRLFGYPSGSAGALLDGTLPLRYCTTRFASRIPTWRLPVPMLLLW